jgi:Na+/proline symporter
MDLIVLADSYGLTTARLVATSAALLGLAGVIVGGLTWSRARRGNGFSRRGAVVAAVTGLVATVVGVIGLVVADGGPGTGNGVVGAWAAVVLGPVALVLGVGRTRAKT